MSFLLFSVLLLNSERKTPCTQKDETVSFYKLASQQALDTTLALSCAGELFADFLTHNAEVRVLILAIGTGQSA